MISHLNKLTNKPVDIQHVIRSTMANVLLQVILCYKYFLFWFAQLPLYTSYVSIKFL